MPTQTKARPMPLKPRFLRAGTKGSIVGVDRENSVIRGYVVAQEGPFKTPGRGEFDKDALRSIVTLMNGQPQGVKSRFAHPTLSDDGIGKFLGRVKDARLDRDRVRADLHLDETSFDTPSGNLGKYVLDLAESDSDALSSSVVIDADEEFRIDEKGRPLEDSDGNPLPPLWRPKQVFASDIVDEGDAVDGLLSIGALPDAAVRQGAALLDSAFAGQSREVIQARALAWLGRYLDFRFGECTGEPEAVEQAQRFPGARADLAEMAAVVQRAKLKPQDD